MQTINYNLKELFIELHAQYGGKKELINNYWKFFIQQYSDKERYYHNLSHINNMIKGLEQVKDHIIEFNNLSLAILYHDIIYDVMIQDNEFLSAQIATPSLNTLNFPNTSIQFISDAINATKFHDRNINNDINYLLDIDIAILGADKLSYQQYTNSIRKEYQIFPDQLFYTGRKKVLAHFLSLESIYKTKYFIQKYEQNAKMNINNKYYKLELRAY